MRRITKRVGKLFLIICVIGLMLTLVQCKPDQTFPEEGIWYCAELQMQICFDKDRTERYTFAIIDGEKRNCALYTDYGNRFFSVVYMYEVNGKYDSTIIYEGEFMSFNEEVIVTRDAQTQTKYVFVRVLEQE